MIKFRVYVAYRGENNVVTINQTVEVNGRLYIPNILDLFMIKNEEVISISIMRE